MDAAAAREAAVADVESAQQRLAQLDAEIGAADRITDTRGQGIQYHGARGPITALSEGYANEANIYGSFETFYTTDAADIATGYFRKNPNAVLYATRETAPVRFFDMEEAMPVSEWERRLGIGPEDADLLGMALEEAELDHGAPNLRQIMDAARDLSRSEGLSRSEVQEYFDGITYTLQQEGYGGMRHIGGLRTNQAAHEVKIYFRPWEQIEIQAVPIPRDGVPAELQTQRAAAAAALQKAEARAAELDREVARLEAEAARAEAVAAPEARLAAFIDADPELKALVEDTEALAAEAGVRVEASTGAGDPSTVAEAIRAAAVCLTSELVA